MSFKPCSNFCGTAHIDLPILSENIKLFEEIGTRVIVSPKRVIDICNDKWETYLFCREHEIHVPKTYCSLQDVDYAITARDVSYPLIVKPRWGMGSIGIYVAETPSELINLYGKVESEIKNSYLKYESANHEGKMALIQEKLEGQEYGLDIINNLDGEYQNTSVKQKLAMRAGETDCAETVENTSLKDLGETLSNLLHHVANLDVDVFLVEGVPYVLEMNARFGGGYPFSHMAGVNLPLAIVQWLRGEPVDSAILTAKPGILSHKDIQLVTFSKQ